MVQIKKLEDAPTKQELMRRIAVALKMVPTRLAMGIKPDRHIVKIAAGIKQIPQKVGSGVQAISELDEDKSKIAGDVAKTSA